MSNGREGGREGRLVCMRVLYPILCLRGHITIFLGAVAFHEGRMVRLFWTGNGLRGLIRLGGRGERSRLFWTLPVLDTPCLGTLDLLILVYTSTRVRTLVLTPCRRSFNFAQATHSERCGYKIFDKRCMYVCILSTRNANHDQ